MKSIKYLIKRISKILIVAIATLGSTFGFSQDLEETTINIGWHHQFQFAGIYAAKELGYFAEAGLNVTIKEGNGIFNPNWILEEQGRYGIALSGQILENSKRDSLLIVAIMFQQSHLSLATRRKDSINVLRDLIGKKVNVGPELKAMIRSAGVSLDDVKIFGPQAYLNDLADNKSQAVPFSILDRNIQNSLDPQDYKLFRPIEYGITFYGDCLFTSQMELKENPDRVEKMYQATLRGWKYAIENPDDMIDLIIDKYQWGGSRENLEKESQIVINSLIIPSLYELGFSDKNKWAHMAKVLFSLGLIDNEEIDFESFIYTSQEFKNNEMLARFTKISTSIAISFLLIGAILFAYNRQLSKSVRKRTKHIKEINKSITLKNEELAAQKVDLEKLNYFKDKILAVLSHDIRGPLHTFKGIIDIIDREILEQEEIKLLLYGTGSQLEDVNGFIDSILYWAKNQIHGIKVELETYNLSELVSETIGILALSAKVKKIMIDNNIDSNQSILVDKTLLTTTLRNLISNAIKFCTSNDKIEISSEKMNDHIKVLVSDNGSGMSPAQVKSCFKADVSSEIGTDNETGTGLGLHMCKEFVTLNGGEIGVESVENQGTTFWFTAKTP